MLVLVLAVLTLISGIIAALYWYRSSRVMVMPMEEVDGQIRPLAMSNTTEWLKAVYMGLNKAGKHNKSAAIWTALSVVLGAMTTASGSSAFQTILANLQALP